MKRLPIVYIGGVKGAKCRDKNLWTFCIFFNIPRLVVSDQWAVARKNKISQTLYMISIDSKSDQVKYASFFY